jgi:outer membrane protein TolC
MKQFSFRLPLFAMITAALLVPASATAQPDTPPDAAAQPEAPPEAGPEALPEAGFNAQAMTPAEAMTLGQVLQVAVRQRPSLLEAAIDVEIADAAVLQAAGLDDWAFDVTAAWLSVRRQSEQATPPVARYVGGSDGLSLSGSLVRSFSTGGVLTLNAQTGYTREDYTYYLEDGTAFDRLRDTYAHSLSATFVQPLLRGRGARIARAAQRRARISRDAAELELQSRAVTAVREVVRAYWELAFALRDLQIRQYSLGLAQERLRQTQAGIDAGAVAPTEALAVLQTIATREQEIVASELAIYQSSLELRRLAGLEIGPGAVAISTDAPLAVKPRALDVNELLGHAYAHSPVLAALELQEKNALIEVELTENGLLPELDAALSIGPTGAADSVGQAFTNMITFDDVTVSASLTYRDTIGRRAARGVHRRARAQLSKERLNMADVKAQIASALIIAVKQAEAAQKRMELSQQAIELAEKNIQAEMARFELGRATNFDVLQRQNELQQAQLARARAIVDYLDAVAAVGAVTGDILDTYGVTLDRPAKRP